MVNRITLFMLRLKNIAANLIFVYCIVLSGCNNSEDSENKQVKNLILMIVNSQDLAHVQSGLSENFTDLNLSRAKVQGYSRIKCINNSDTCWHSGLAVLAIGKECNNKTLGLDEDGVAHPNLVELASVRGMSTGLVTSGSVVHATPASFIVHAIDKYQYESIASEYLNSPVDLIIGGGLEYFTNRTDSADLIQRFKNKGYSVYNKAVNLPNSEKLVILFNDHEMSSSHNRYSQSLPESTRLAINSLSLNSNGFFLMIDGSQNDKEFEQDQTSYNTIEMENFDKSVGIAFDFADMNPGTLVIVATDKRHIRISENRNNDTAANNSGKKPANAADELKVQVYAYGTLEKSFEGSHESNEIFDKMVSLLDLEAK